MNPRFPMLKTYSMVELCPSTDSVYGDSVRVLGKNVTHMPREPGEFIYLPPHDDLARKVSSGAFYCILWQLHHINHPSLSHICVCRHWLTGA